MCGIAGIVLLQPNASMPDMGERLQRMADALHHRGPDDEGIYISPGQRAGLMSRRLAIRDLSPAGHMPMSNQEETVWITYNGEVYDTAETRVELERLGYQFRSDSDTEVILHGYEAWGQDVVHRLRGMFAFAILDMRRSTTEPQLFIARDRLGIKPLYYTRSGDALVFASELKGLLASSIVSRDISSAGLVGYLMLGSVPNPLTIYRDVRALEPGHMLTINIPEHTHIPEAKRYWSLPTDTIEPVSYQDAVDQVRSLMEEAVRIHLVSDVPLGAFLSGGLDSSAIVALMREATTGPIRTCSIVFEESAYSEAPYARAMAQAIGAEHFERMITADDVSRELDNVLEAMDQPTVDGINTYFVSQTARQAGLTVALSGLGSDELFGGYPNTFRGTPQAMSALAATHSVPGGARLAALGIRTFTRHHRWSRFQDALKRPVSPASAYLTRRGLFSPSEAKMLVGPDVWEEGSKSFDLLGHVRTGGDSNSHETTHDEDLFAWVSRAELSTYTHHQLLRDTDVMSMANSLEVRVPFLDHLLAEYVLRLPASVKLKGTGMKPLLLEACGDNIPDLVRNRTQKQGFTFPFASWLKNSLRAKIEERLSIVSAHGVIDAASVQALWQGFQKDDVHWSRIWALAVLGK